MVKASALQPCRCALSYGWKRMELEKTDGQGNEVGNSDSPYLKNMIFKSESFPTFPTLYKAH